MTEQLESGRVFAVRCKNFVSATAKLPHRTCAPAVAAAAVLVALSSTIITSTRSLYIMAYALYILYEQYINTYSLASAQDNRYIFRQKKINEQKYNTPYMIYMHP